MRVFWAALLGAWAVTSAASADDWTADKLRGQVLQLVDNQWQPLRRGMVVPDSRVIRTLAGARVTFTRGNETVDLEPNTQIQIYDKAGKKPFTTVKEYFGTVAVEADVQNVQHFAVQTWELAAVVKGTRFTVTTTKENTSVSVRRGHVAVEDNLTHDHVTIRVGQSVSVGPSHQIVAAGSGELPVVLDKHGKPTDPKKAGDAGKKAAKAAKDDKTAGSGGGNDGGKKGKGYGGGHDD